MERLLVHKSSLSFPKIFINNDPPCDNRRKNNRDIIKEELKKKIATGQPIDETPVDGLGIHKWYFLPNERESGSLVAHCVRKAMEVFGQFCLKEDETMTEEVEDFVEELVDPDNQIQEELEM
ncbi:hypothetical protein ABK040_002839 [Willaertia magna]